MLSATERAGSCLALAAALSLASSVLHAHQGERDELVMAEQEPPLKQDATGAAPAPRCPEGERRVGGRCRSVVEQLDMVTIFGLRGTVTSVEDRDAVAGAQLGGHGFIYETGKFYTIRFSHFGFLGGGSGGLEGGLGLAYAMGVIGKLERNHGAFARLGGRAHLFGNDELYASLVELPELQLGYQLLRRRLHFELAARGGAVLVGRYNPDDASRPLGKAFEWGGLASARYELIHLDLEWMRIEARASEPDTPVDVLSGMLCGAVFPVGVCLDLRRYSGAVRPKGGGAASDLTSTYVGLTIGVANEL